MNMKMFMEKNKDFLLGIALGMNLSFLIFNFSMIYLNINYDFYKKPTKHIL